MTDTPEKEAIEAASKKNLLKNKRNSKFSTVSTRKRKPITNEENDFRAEEYKIDAQLEEISIKTSLQNEDNFTIRDLKENDFLLIKLAGKKTFFYYIARVMQVHGKECKVQYLRRKENTKLFYYPEVAEIYDANFENIVRKLPNPIMIGGTSKAPHYHKFDFDFKDYTVK